MNLPPPEKQRIDITVTSGKCCSCSACANKCPEHAISMILNDEGFYEPRIDEELCTHCGICEHFCPTLHPRYENIEQPRSYAVMGDDTLRMKSSSGGVFSMLAEPVLERGGYVCGAAYDDNWNVNHIVINKKEDLPKLRKSKYMQSNMGTCFSEIRKLLMQGSEVLFSGTPCQVAGLKSFLHKPYENLLTVDIVCHGIPSISVFHKFLKENSNEKIQEIDFREKEVWGWQTHTNIRYESGEVYRRAFDDCPYFRGFLANFFLNKICGSCPFAKIPRQADITLGDYWMIRKYNPSFTDSKGTGLVLTNSEKGQKAFDMIKAPMKLLEETPLEFACLSNPNLIKPFSHHKNRDLFYRRLKDHTYVDAFKYAIGEKYDVCVVGVGWADNYGAALTNYGLVKVLEDLGLSVLVFDKPHEYHTEKDPNITQQFNAKYLNVSKRYNKFTVTQLNELADTFIVGSDQVWHWNPLSAFREYLMLEFVLDSKKKISYASSFGHSKLTAPIEHQYVYSYLLSRFDAISVREKTGLRILERLGIKNAQHVLDPVFLCNAQHFIDLATAVPRRREGNYVFSYILDPHRRGNKKELLLKLSKHFNLPLYNTVDMLQQDQKAEMLGLEIEKDLGVEEFLNAIYYSSFVVTDSFHGVAFSIILRKPFICIANTGRGIDRFESLLGHLHLMDRLFYNADDVMEDSPVLDESIDWDSIETIIGKDRISSQQYLEDAIAIKKDSTSKASAFDAYRLISLMREKSIYNEIHSIKPTEHQSFLKKVSISGDKTKTKYFGGLYKKVKSPTTRKYYFFGIRVFFRKRKRR